MIRGVRIRILPRALALEPRGEGRTPPESENMCKALAACCDATHNDAAVRRSVQDRLTLVSKALDEGGAMARRWLSCDRRARALCGIPVLGFCQDRSYRLSER